jgi:hypothetical protein
MDKIREVAQSATDMDSLMSTVDFWGKAEEPLAFVRHCVELAGYESAKAQGKPFKSHLPIQIDATTSGLQIWGVIGKDANTGKLVNLESTDFPSDAYKKVAGTTTKLLEEDAENPKADWWLRFGVNRSVAKNPVMTLQYGAKDLASQIMSKTLDDQVRKYMTLKSDIAALSGRDNLTEDEQTKLDASRQKMETDEKMQLLKEIEDDPSVFLAPDKKSEVEEEIGEDPEMEEDEKPGNHYSSVSPFTKAVKGLAKFLDKKMKGAIKEEFPAPYAGMEWLQKVARIASESAIEGSEADLAQKDAAKRAAEEKDAEDKAKQEYNARKTDYKAQLKKEGHDKDVQKQLLKEWEEENKPAKEKKGKSDKPSKVTYTNSEGKEVEVKLEQKGETYHQDQSTGEWFGWNEKGERMFTKSQGLGHDIHWTGFSGWPVRQEYDAMAKGRQYKVDFAEDPNQELKPRTYQKADFHEGSGQYLGLPPNFIHSLDGAILDKVAAKLKEQGVPAIQTIHDSYGTHAKYVPMLRKAITETLQELYDADVLKKFYEEVKAQLPEAARARLEKEAPLPDFESMEGFKKLSRNSIGQQKYAFHP